MRKMLQPANPVQMAETMSSKIGRILYRTYKLLNNPQWTAVLIIDAIISALFVRDIPISSGMMVYGNLPAFYLYGPPNQLWLIDLNLFNLSAQFLSYTAGPFAAQTVVYLASIFLPSLGILFLVNRLPVSKVIGVALAVTLGTPLNPLMFQSFLTGSFTVFPWFLLTCLSLGLTIDAQRFKERRQSTLLILAGIAYGLSLTTTNFIPTGAYITLPIMMGVLALAPARVKSSNSRFRSQCTHAALFMIPAAGISFPFALDDIIHVGSVVSGTASLGVLNSYIANTISYEFAQYGVTETIFGAVWNGTNGYLTGPAWFLLVGIGVAGGIGFLLSKGDPWGPLYRFCAIEYLLTATLMFLLHTGAATQLLIETRIFDSFDYPDFFLFIQQFDLLFLLPTILTLIVERVVIQYRRTSHGIIVGINVAPPNNTQAAKCGLHTSIKPSHPNLRTKVLPLAAATLIVALVSYNSGGFILEAQYYLTRDQGDVFVPTYYSGIHAWYVSHASELTGQVLILPNDYTSLNNISGFIPKSKIWNAPIGLPALDAAENITLYQDVLSALYSRDSSEFGTLLARSGVQDVVVIKVVNQVTIVPNEAPYNLQSPLLMPISVLTATLANGSSFSMDYSSGYFTIYNNNDYLGLSNVTTSAVAFVGTPSGNLPSLHLLNAMSYADYGSYPSENINRSGQNYTLDVYANSSIPSALLYFNQSVVDFSTTNPYVSIQLSAAASFSVPSGLVLSPFILFYNSSTAGFWSEFDRVNLGTYTADGSMSIPVKIPSGAIRLNLVFFAWTQNKSSGRVQVQAPQLSLNRTVIDIAKSSVQFDITDYLIQDHVIPRSSILFPYPFFNQSQQSLSLQTRLVWIESLISVDPALSLNFSMTPSQLTTYRFADRYGAMTFVALIAPGTGYHITISASGKSVLMFGNVSLSERLDSASLGTISPNSSLMVSLSSTNGVVLLGVVVEQVPPQPGIFYLSLPIGRLQAQYGNLRTQWSISFESANKELTPSLYIVLPPYVGVGGCFLWVFRHRLRRSYGAGFRIR